MLTILIGFLPEPGIVVALSKSLHFSQCFLHSNIILLYRDCTQLFALHQVAQTKSSIFAGVDFHRFHHHHQYYHYRCQHHRLRKQLMQLAVRRT